MSSKVALELDVNGQKYQLEIDPSRMLLDVLREELGLFGTKVNCREGECGACTVLIDGKAINSCLYLAVRAVGKKIVTIEGLEVDGKLHPVQQAFIDNAAVQCGYCTPGFVLATLDLLSSNPHPSDEEINMALSGNICRCTGYADIRRAVRAAAEMVEEEEG